MASRSRCSTGSSSRATWCDEAACKSSGCSSSTLQCRVIRRVSGRCVRAAASSLPRVGGSSWRWRRSAEPVCWSTVWWCLTGSRIRRRRAVVISSGSPARSWSARWNSLRAGRSSSCSSTRGSDSALAGMRVGFRTIDTEVLLDRGRGGRQGRRRRLGVRRHDARVGDRGAGSHDLGAPGPPGRSGAARGRRQRSHRRRHQRWCAGRPAMGARRGRRTAVLVRGRRDGRRRCRCPHAVPPIPGAGCPRPCPFGSSTARLTTTSPGENGELRYGEGLFIGYRGFEHRGIEPRYPFGHGLSYTTFEFGEPSLSSDTFRRGTALVGHRRCAQQRRSGRERGRPVLRRPGIASVGPTEQGAEGLRQGPPRTRPVDARSLSSSTTARSPIGIRVSRIGIGSRAGSPPSRPRWRRMTGALRVGRSTQARTGW